MTHENVLLMSGADKETFTLAEFIENNQGDLHESWMDAVKDLKVGHAAIIPVHFGYNNIIRIPANIDEVKDFISVMQNDYNLAFHPDTDAADYINQNGAPTFSPREANCINLLIEQCFTICKESGVDFYELVLEEAK